MMLILFRLYRYVLRFLVATSLIGCCFPAVAQSVKDADVQRYLKTFSQRPKPTSSAKINYRSLVATQKTPIRWLVGKWITLDGFIAIYPSGISNRVCLITHTTRSSTYAEGTLQGAYLRTETPAFTSQAERFLTYAAGDVFVPVIYRGKAYLGWGLYDQTQQRTRFLTLAFYDRPPAPTIFLKPGRTADAIQAQFEAAGCQDHTQIRKAPVQQTIRGVTAGVSPLSQNQSSRAFQIQFTNGTQAAFGFMPNRVVVYDENNRRIPSTFTSLLHGMVIQPGGTMRGTVTILGKLPKRISVFEATPGGRQFSLPISTKR